MNSESSSAMSSNPQRLSWPRDLWPLIVWPNNDTDCYLITRGRCTGLSIIKFTRFVCSVFSVIEKQAPTGQTYRVTAWTPSVGKQRTKHEQMSYQLVDNYIKSILKSRKISEGPPFPEGLPFLVSLSAVCMYVLIQLNKRLNCSVPGSNTQPISVTF